MKRMIALFMFVNLVLVGCVTIGHDRANYREGLIKTKYDTIRKIVIEEAANNGFSQLTSEIKPSKYNDWKGQLHFALTTTNGTDQLFVEFKGDSVYMHGAGTRTNPDSAIKAIRERIDML